MWVGISLPYATFAIIVEDCVVIEAAPIAKWAVGKKQEDVIRYYRRKGAKVKAIP